MKKMVIKIDGMMCGMCESHVNDAIRRAFEVKKVKASHKHGEAEIIAEDAIAEEDLKGLLEKDGYMVTGYSCEDYVKKGLFH